MNKTELIVAVVEKTGLSKKDVTAVVETMLETIQYSLAEGIPVKLQNFGNFEVRERVARKGRNPQDGSEIDIPASKNPAWKPSKTLKEFVNQ